MKKLPMIAAIALSAALLGCSKSELHVAMEDMGGSLKAIYQTESLDEMKAQTDAFFVALEKAKSQVVNPEDQATFEEGLKEVEELALQVKAALEAGDAAAAKALFPQLKDVKEEYHDKFGVE
ncbi:cytochrome b562 [Pseudomaricurvus sp. HS19]|uniref:cytochrome b562 n=1 Tax=Pseudomaricurvus sp. HS19 TaxID=2692626 RepID=UPI001371E496|nr:cytochrome b562 [Pseudomaricurvus sp. HS19]MYM64434.1 hypothetical protein [Pseudomaricurvus sp. HS19]